LLAFSILIAEVVGRQCVDDSSGDVAAADVVVGE